MSSTKDLINHILITQSNKTETRVYSNTTLLPFLANSTMAPLNNITWYPISNTSGCYNSSNYWNYSLYNSSIYGPYYSSCITTASTPIIIFNYVFFFVLLTVAFICIKIGISRRKELEQRAAVQRRRAQQVTSAHVTTIGNNSNIISARTEEFDLPPTYEDVVQSYILNKQEQSSTENSSVGNSTAMTTNPSSNTLSPTISTLTIETEISNSSNNDIANNRNNQSISP